MSTDNILAQNIDLLVYGPSKEKFLDIANINRPVSTIYERKHLSKPKPEHSHPSIKTEELNKLHMAYCSKINKMQDLYDENKPYTSKAEKNATSVLRKDAESHYFTWGDLRKSTVTISTMNFWINANFCLISDMLLDPYTNSVVTGNVNLLIITFNPSDKESCRKALALYLKLETEKPPSSIKYQSQKLLLQQGYYHSYNENIVLALCETPHVEPVGKCLLVGIGGSESQGSMDNAVKEMKVKNVPKVLMLDETSLEECGRGVVELYDWIFESHNKMKESLSLDEGQKKELREAIKKSFTAKHTDEKKECAMF